MSLWMILAVLVVVATTISMSACILAGRSERFLEDPALDEAAYQQDLPLARPSSDIAPVPVRFAAHSDRIEL